MCAAISTIRNENMCGGIIWFPIAATKKTTNLYCHDVEALSADEAPDKPFYLWDLVGVSKSDFSHAYTSKPAAQFSKHHGLSLVVRELSTAKFVAICSEDGGVINQSVTPSYSDIAVGGAEMDDLAKRISMSFRAVGGTADMEIVHDDSAKKRSADDSGGDGDGIDGGSGGGKRQKSSNSSNIHLEMNMKVQELFEHHRSDDTPPTEMEQAYASIVLKKMMRKSNGVATIFDGAGGTNQYVLKRRSEDRLPWIVGDPIEDSSTLQKRRKRLRMDMFSLCKGNLSVVASVLNPSSLFDYFRKSKGIRGKPELEEVLDKIVKGDAMASSKSCVIDKTIVDNVKSFLSIEAHQLKGENKGGSRPDGVQHFLNGLVCAVSSEDGSIQSRIAKRLGLSQHSMEKGKKDRAKANALSSSTAKAVHVYCKPFERAERGDKYDDIAHQVVHDFCHDLEVSGVDSNVDASKTCSVVLPSGSPAKHSFRVWLEKGNMKLQYQTFLKSEYYAAFQKRVMLEKSDYYSEKKKPTICFESFCGKVCDCVGDPTEMSCVDMTRDTLQLSLEGMEGYVSQNKEKLRERLSKCVCADCILPRIRKSVERCPEKEPWIDLFARRDKNSVSYILGKVQCPRVGQPSLTLDSDEHEFNMYQRACGRLSCWDCGPVRKLQWNCPVFMDNNDEVEYWEWEKCETSGGEQNQMVQKTAKVKELMAALRKKIEAGIVHDFDKTWLSRTRHVDVRTFPKKTAVICTDFSAMLSLRPNRTKCAHVDRHAVLAIFYVLTNPRDVVLADGTTIRVTDCDVWHIFGNAENKDTKNDHVFHHACLDYIIKYYIEEKNLDLDTIRLWTDNCTGQYKCRQNFYRLSKIPLGENSIKIAEHCFAQVYSFKGPWDAAGKVIKWFIRRLERMEKSRVEDAFQCYEHATVYFAEKLPSDTDWKKLEEELSMKLKDMLDMPQMTKRNTTN